MKNLNVPSIAFVLLTAASWMAAVRDPVRSDESQAGAATAPSGVTRTNDEAIGAAEKARAELQKAKSDEDPDEKAGHQKKARDFFEEARRKFRAAHDNLKAAYEKFDKFIPKENAVEYDAREQAYRMYIQAQLNLAVTTFEEAQTWEPETAQRKALLTQAADEFALIHARYRQQIAGLYARMYQGKCFDEQNDVVKALGIYNELLGHGGDKPSAALKRLQDSVRLFRLICLNREVRKDYAVVIREAEDWLAANEETATTRVGLGIQWELARALEQLALKEENNIADRRRMLTQAIKTARTIQRHPGEYKAPANAMIERLQGELDDE